MPDSDIPTEALEAAARDVIPAPLIGATEAYNPQRSPKIFGPGPNPPPVPTESLEAARAAYDSVVIAHGAAGHRRGHHDAIIAAVAAAAPHLIAEGRRQAARDIRRVDVAMVENLDGDSTRIGLTVAANIAERGQ